jgi:Uncharacterized alpha/beta hydrolase domain (DUF2235)
MNFLDQGEITKGPKNIVLCIDGTGDWAGTNSTNVIEIFERCDRETQRVFYTGGVGTLANATALSKSRRMFLKLLDLAVATGLRDNVLQAYDYLVEEYEPGDRIYLFGFSRGAFACRLVAAVIHRFGILRREHKNLSPYVWQTISSFSSFAEFIQSSDRIKSQFAVTIDKESGSKDAPIHFAGLFDTVSSVGIFERFKVFPYTDKNSSIQIVRHAVSIHETRNAFPESPFKPYPNQDVLEVWFPGVHRDVGGGESSDPGYENDTLHWMIEEAKIAGLSLTQDREPEATKRKHIPLFDPFVFVGLYPMKMFDFTLRRPPKGDRELKPSLSHRFGRWLRSENDTNFRWYWPNFKHPRPIPIGAFKFNDDQTLVRHPQPTLDERPDLTLDEIQTIQIRAARSTKWPQYEMPRIGAPDFFGILLGVILSFLFFNRGVRWNEDGSLLGSSWPQMRWTIGEMTTATWANVLFFGFVIQQGFWQKLGTTKAGSLFNTIIPPLGGLVALAIVYSALMHEDVKDLNLYQRWPALWIGFGLALIVLIFALGPIRRPILRADRTVSLFMVPWFLLMASSWLLLRIVIPIGLAIYNWFGNEGATFEPGAIWGQAVWGLGAVFGIRGLWRILKDRGLIRIEKHEDTGYPVVC